MKYLFIGILAIVLAIGCCPTKPLPVKRQPASPPIIVPKVMKGGHIVDCKLPYKSNPDFKNNP